MRQIAITLLLFVCFFQSRAQKYVLGVPIYDTIKKGSFNVFPHWTYLCTGARVFTDMTIANAVTGVNYYLLITGSTLKKDSLRQGDDRNNDLGPVNVGDSFLLTHNNAIRDWGTYDLYFGTIVSQGNFKY